MYLWENGKPLLVVFALRKLCQISKRISTRTLTSLHHSHSASTFPSIPTNSSTATPHSFHFSINTNELINSNATQPIDRVVVLGVARRSVVARAVAETRGNADLAVENLLSNPTKDEETDEGEPERQTQDVHDDHNPVRPSLRSIEGFVNFLEQVIANHPDESDQDDRGDTNTDSSEDDSDEETSHEESDHESELDSESEQTEEDSD